MWFKKKPSKKEMEYFSSEWLDAWAESIRNSGKYRKAGANWNAPLIIRIKPKPEGFEDDHAVGIYLHLSYGECKELRYAYESDIEKTDFILTANDTTWINIIENSKDPTMAIMMGSIKIEKGSLITLSTHQRAASELLKTAPSVYEGIPLVKQKISTVPDPTNSNHQRFVTTSKGLDHESFPMKLFQKAKQFGTWNPSDINLTADVDQWKTFSDEEKQILTHLCSLFMAGEEAVTLDLLPLIQSLQKKSELKRKFTLHPFYGKKQSILSSFPVMCKQ